MLDKSVPLCFIIMCKTDTENYPRYELPEGYSFSMYKDGDELEWAQLEVSVGQYDCAEKGLECFRREFVEGHNLPLSERMLFVRDKDGKVVATGTLWNGIYLGKERQRLHWIATDESCKGKGIAKAMVTRLLDIYNDLGYKGFIYLITESWCYSAVNIYRKFGFKEYVGKNPVEEFDMSDEEFQKQNELGIRLISEKIDGYRKDLKKHD